MPELPEVEAFRKTLLPLVSKTCHLKLERVRDNPPRNFISDEQIQSINKAGVKVSEVTRKGKLLCMVLDCSAMNIESKAKAYIFIHMGMTGRISSPTQARIPSLETLPECTEYPPPHTHLIMTIVNPKSKNDVKAEASFSDPRKFGFVEFALDQTRFEELAPDAYLDVDRDMVLPKLVGQSKPIKAMLLDQKRIVSGVGNWIADEVLYEAELHPDQIYLTQEEGETLLDALAHVLKVALECLDKDQEFPSDWIFPYRWKTKDRDKLKDSKGRKIEFVKAGGRTSAIVPAIQRKKSRQRLKRTTSTPTKKKEPTTTVSENVNKKATSKRKKSEANENTSPNDTNTSTSRPKRRTARSST